VRRLGQLSLPVCMWWLPALVWMGVIFGFSSWPSPPSIGTSLVDFIVKKSAHFTEFGILALLLLYAMRGSWRNISRRQQLAALALAAIYAASDELHQMFTGGRSPSARDVAIDIAGAITFLLLRAGFYQDLPE
jgi:VanZ family protein